MATHPDGTLLKASGQIDDLKHRINAARAYGQRLDQGIQRTLEDSFGLDLSAVRIHTGRTANALAREVGADAFTCGADIFFASDVYRPQTKAGLWLLTHEVAHVIQQARGLVSDQLATPGVVMGVAGNPWENEADDVAARVVEGLPVSIASGLDTLASADAVGRAARPMIIQCHDSFEHRALGDVSTADLRAIATNGPQRNNILNREIQLLWQWHQNPESVTEAQIKQLCPWINTLRLSASGLLVTYGELNALPDYIATPSSVDTIPKSVLLPLLQFIRQEGFIQLNKLLGRTVSDAFQYAPYTPWQLAPTILDKLLESSALDNLTLSLGIKGVDHYGGLLARNACHFAPYSWYRWQSSYLIARDLATRAHNTTDPNERARLTYQAWIYHGYADHFLQDSFAAGHLVNKTLIMQWFIDWATNQSLVPVSDWDAVKYMTTSLQPGLAGRQLYNPSYGGKSNDPQTAEDQPAYMQRLQTTGVLPGPGDEDTSYQNYLTFLSSLITQSASASIHDFYNSHSLWVGSVAHPAAYEVWGDATLLSGSNGGDGAQFTSEMAQMSQQSIRELLANGQTSVTAQQIRDHFPTTVLTNNNQMISLEAWNNTQQSFCASYIFPQLHDIIVRIVNPRVSNVSQDVGARGIGGYDLGAAADRGFTCDYDGTGKLDHLVFYRPGKGAIFILKNSAGNFSAVYAQGDPGSGIGTYSLTDPADQAFAFDYDGTGKLDHLVLYRPGTGTIYILKNSAGQFSPVYTSHTGIGGYDLGVAADRGFAFDYDGTGKLDHLVFYRPGKGAIFILKNSAGNFSAVYAQGDPGSGIGTYNLKSPADQAFAFDYDGSGKLDHLVFYRPGTGAIFILKNSAGQFSPVYAQGDPGSGIGTYNLKSPADQAFAFDYDGSGKLDHLVFYRPGTGAIFILKKDSAGNFSPVYQQGDPGIGIGGYDLKSPADRGFAFDYDGSGKLDHLVLYRPGAGMIGILKNSSGQFSPVYQMHLGAGLAVAIYNQGAYVARGLVEWDFSGQHQVWQSGNLLVVQNAGLLVPAGATNILIRCEEDTGLVWEPQKTIFDKTYAGPAKVGMHKTYTLTGTTLNPGYSEEGSPDLTPSGKSSWLGTGAYLVLDDYLVSDNNQCFAIMQSDGNFVLYHGSGPANQGPAYWASNTVLGPGQYFATMQSDGNFVLYHGSDPAHQGAAYWVTNTAAGPGQYFAVIQNDANFVLYQGSDPTHQGAFRWNTGVVNGQVTVHNQGGYVARSTVEWDLGGQHQSQSSGNFLLGQTYSAGVPAGATNIHVTCEDATGLVWDPWKTILDKTYPSPSQKTFTLTGTTLNPSFSEQ